MKRRTQSPRKTKTGSRSSQSRLKVRVKERRAELDTANKKLKHEGQRRKRLDEILAAERCPSGVEGLDDILAGGLPRGGFFLIQGDPGSGKTTLALQFLREGLRRGRRFFTSRFRRPSRSCCK